VRKRDVLILKMDKQRSLSDEIIHRQRLLIEGEKEEERVVEVVVVSHLTASALEAGKRGRDAEGKAVAPRRLESTLSRAPFAPRLLCVCACGLRGPRHV
jgi:hypothetical protein